MQGNSSAKENDGGPVVSMRNYAMEQARRGHDVRVYTIEGYPNTSPAVRLAPPVRQIVSPLAWPAALGSQAARRTDMALGHFRASRPSCPWEAAEVRTPRAVGGRCSAAGVRDWRRSAGPVVRDERPPGFGRPGGAVSGDGVAPGLGARHHARESRLRARCSVGRSRESDDDDGAGPEPGSVGAPWAPSRGGETGSRRQRRNGGGGGLSGSAPAGFRGAAPPYPRSGKLPIDCYGCSSQCRGNSSQSGNSANWGSSHN